MERLLSEITLLIVYQIKFKSKVKPQDLRGNHLLLPACPLKNGEMPKI